MTTRGRLDEVSFPDLLQILSSTRKSGKLTLTRRDAYGVVVFRHGRVVYAASERPRSAFGSLLVARGLVSEAVLREALEAQNRAARERRLGAILVEVGELAPGDLRSVMVEQLAGVFRDLLAWEEGYFKFQSYTVPDRGEVEVDCQDLVVDEGLEPDGVLVRAMTRDTGPEDPRDPAPGDGHTLGTLSLRQVMAEVRSPAFTGETTLQILRYASHVLRRGVLFVLGAGHARPLGQFGLEPEDAPADGPRLRRLALPLDQPSVVAEAAASQETVCGRPARTAWNERLARALGGGLPDEAVAIPVTVSGASAFVLYGDNAPGEEPIACTESLELLMIEAGLALEKTALERRLEEVEARLRR